MRLSCDSKNRKLKRAVANNANYAINANHGIHANVEESFKPRVFLSQEERTNCVNDIKVCCLTPF
jgi:hypothetical protein